MDCSSFLPICEIDREHVRRRNGIPLDAKVFLFVFRNQPRKQAVIVLEGFAKFKKENPHVNAKLHFHTSFSEKSHGWDIPVMMKYYGLKPDDVVTTYICKNCKSWHIHPFIGENRDCPHCRTKGSCHTVSINNSVPAHEMQHLYGNADGVINAMSSGGLELNCVQALLCGKPLAVTNYSCGIDYCTPETADFVTPLSYHVYHEQGTNFIKAATDVDDIASFMKKISGASQYDLDRISERARTWAYDRFSVEKVGARWEKIIDALPPIDFESITLSAEDVRKNDAYPFPTEISNPEQFVSDLYKNVMLTDEPITSEGFQHWMKRIEHGFSFKSIWQSFIGIAKQDNLKIDEKNATAAKVVEPAKASVDANGKKRLLLIMRQSIGDVYMISSLLRSISETYPNHNIYFATEERYSNILADHPLIYRQINYVPEMESETHAISNGDYVGFFDVYLHPGIPTQRQRCYLSKAEPVFKDLNYP
jgi:hypothetical protein